MRKRIKATGFSDWDTMFYNNLLSIPVLLIFSLVLEDWSSGSLNRNLYVNSMPLPSARRFYSRGSLPIQPAPDTQPTPFCHRILGRCRSGDFIYYSVVHPRDEQYDIQVRAILVLECATVDGGPYDSMTGALNKLPVAASGMIFFGDAVTFGSISAVSVGFFAGVLYAIAKNNQKKADGAAKAETIIPMTRRE
jgi:GDP-mannose transporter